MNEFITQGEATRIGKILTKASEESQEYEAAIDDANQWRLQHLESLIGLFEQICKLLDTNFNSAILVTMRLKRMKSILKKLLRPHTHFKLGELDDIGGCRIIAETPQQVQEIESALIEHFKLSGITVVSKDYIFDKDNKRTDGYRSLHLLVRIPLKHEGKESKVRLEIQIRTEKQHLWATAIESMGEIYSSDYKTPPVENAGEEELLIRRYFALVSNLIALDEECVPVSGCPSDQEGTLQELEEYEYVLRERYQRSITEDLVQGQEGVTKIDDDHLRSWQVEENSFYLFRVNTSQQILAIGTAANSTKNKLLEAARQYFMAEDKKPEKNAAHMTELGWTNVVLAATSNAKKLNMAYPSYFLDSSEYVELVNRLKGREN